MSSSEGPIIDVQLQSDIKTALTNPETEISQLEAVAHRLGRLVNLRMRGDEATELSVPNGCIKLLAEEFTDEKREQKGGEIYEFMGEQHEPFGRFIPLLSEAADVVGKYALGIERVAKHTEDLIWEGFAGDMAAVIGFDYALCLRAFIAKYSVRISEGKDGAKELQAVSTLGRKGGFVQKRVHTGRRLFDLRKRYPIDEQLGAIPGRDLSAVGDDLRYVRVEMG
ncbi:MAG TPA: hypothetical protein ENI23_14150 [bacterium]|nr:hypothetical protein [bacterium]